MATKLRSTATNASTNRDASGSPSGDAQTTRVAHVPDPAITALLAIVLLGLAESSARNEWVSEFILPAPSHVAAAFVSGFRSGIYWEHIVSTLIATGGGFVLASVTAILLAGVLTSTPRLEHVFLPFVVAFQTLPKIAIAPLVILWLGFDNLGKTFVVTIVCFFPILVNSIQGLRIRDVEQLELMRALGASKLQLFRYIRVPNSLPYIFAGLHIGALFALIGAVVAEFVGSRAGLGYLLLQQKAQFNVPGVFAILVLLMAVGLLFNRATLYAEQRVAFWSRDVSVAAA